MGQRENQGSGARGQGSEKKGAEAQSGKKGFEESRGQGFECEEQESKTKCFKPRRTRRQPPAAE